jgi:hypothetical protein
LLRAINGQAFEKVEFLDIGASSGISTAEFLSAACSTGLSVTAIATDINLSAKIECFGRPFRVLIDSARRALQFEVFGLGLRPWLVRRDYISGYALVCATLHALHGGARMYYRLVKGEAVRQVEVLLVSPRAIAKGVEFVEDNIMESPSNGMKSRFNVLRIMNVANLVYFSRKELRIIAAGVLARASLSGVIVQVGRVNEDGALDSTTFTVREGRAIFISRTGRGSEVENYFAEALGAIQ